MTYEDKLLGIPVISNAFGMMYNQELFDQAGISAMPATFTELEAACEKLSAAGIQPFTNGYKEWWVYKYVFQNFIDVASASSTVRQRYRTIRCWLKIILTTWISL